MKTATDLRQELCEMRVLTTHIGRYCKKDLETLIAGIKDTASRVGEEVHRDTLDYYRKFTGTIIEIKGDRARVQWDDKKTWYKLNKLVTVKR